MTTTWWWRDDDDNDDDDDDGDDNDDGDDDDDDMFPIHLQGSIAIAGAGVQWLRDNLGIIGETSDVGKPFGFNLPRRLFGNVLIFILYAFVDRILRFKVFVLFFF